MSSEPYDHLFKVLLVGDSGVGKSCLLMRFASNTFEDNTTSTIGVDFKVKRVTVNGQACKLTIWDTAGQERFRTLTSSYYRGAQGVVLVYDVTQRQTFDDLEGVWLREVDMYSTVEDSIKMLVGNKTDLTSQRQVSSQEGHDFAKRHGCLFVETSARANVAVEQAFHELLMQILQTPGLLEGTGTASGVKMGAMRQQNQEASCYC